MNEQDFERVYYDKVLHNYSNKHWHYWYHSKEHATAFQKYFKEGTVPRYKYPYPLTTHHSKTGTVSFAKLEGTHNWKNKKWRYEFQASAIYNRELSKWVSKNRSASKRRSSSTLKALAYNIPRIITILCVIFTLMYLMNSWGIMRDIPLIAVMVILSIGAIASFWSMVKYDGIVMKILYFIYGGICAFICLSFFGVIPTEVAITVSILVPLVIILMIFFIITLLLRFIKFFIPSLGIGAGLGFGGLFGGRSGWILAGKLFGKK